MNEETCRELAACLEKLRWSLAGARAGGLEGWPRPPGQPAISGPETAKVESAPPPPTPDIVEPGAGDRLSSPPSSGTGTHFRQAGKPAPHGLAAGELDEVSRSLSGCSKCRLHAGRTNLVFGEGTTGSGIVFVGEGPGFDEDKQGRPFVGRAGKLLDKMIQAMGYGRFDVYICNVVKCRPPDNRTPLPDEIEACLPFLVKQITALSPKVICALGACASHSLLPSTKPMSQLRGKVHLWRGIPLVCTYHPAYLLRNPIQKAATWQDLKEVLGILRSDIS